MPKIQNEAEIKFANKLAIDTNCYEDSLNLQQDPSTITHSNHPMGSTNLTFNNQNTNSNGGNGKAKENANKNKSLSKNFNNNNNLDICNNGNGNNNNDFESLGKLVKKNTCASAKVESTPTINEKFINFFNNRTKSKKISGRTNSITSENQIINNNNLDIDNNNIDEDNNNTNFYNNDDDDNENNYKSKNKNQQKKHQKFLLNNPKLRRRRNQASKPDLMIFRSLCFSSSFKLL